MDKQEQTIVDVAIEEYSIELRAGTLLQGGRYRIVKAIGQGGFGITYLAEQTMAGRKVCIKEYFPVEYYNRDADTNRISLGSQGSADVMSRYKEKFIKEARTLASLNHPHIIPVHDVFEENDTAYYVMEYIEGETISDIVRRDGALAESRAVRYIKDVASALSYLHNRQTTHLDVKPSNIMVRREDDRAILIDFGLSKHYDDKGKQTTSTPGGVSHGYAPTEMYDSCGTESFNPRIDIYSLGATLYHMVVGEVPPRASEVLNNGIGRLPARLSATTCNAIERTMQPSSAQRPQSVGALLKLLEGGEPKPSVHRKSRWWVWLLIVAIVAIGGYFALNGSQESEKAKVEQARIAEEKRNAEEAEKARIAEEKRNAEEAEKARIAEEKRNAEEAEKARIAEEKRNAEEAEQARIAEEKRINDMVARGLGRDGVYEVGDYYNRNNKKGVVFFVSDGGRHGKILSLDEAKLKWCTSEQHKRRILVGASSEDDGKYNTDKVMNRSDSREYPAFAWCRNKGNDWYLPSDGELETISKNKSKINQTLSVNIGEELKDGWYWSSTEGNEFYALFVSMYYVFTINDIKYLDYRVRAVSAF